MRRFEAPPAETPVEPAAASTPLEEKLDDHLDRASDRPSKNFGHVP
jgi:hypothetical protein